MLNILLADRDTNLRQQVKAALKENYNVLESNNGIEAIEIGERENIALYLVNEDMPFILEKDFISRFDTTPMIPMLVYGKETEKLKDTFPSLYYVDFNGNVEELISKIQDLLHQFYGDSKDLRYFSLLGLEVDYFTHRVRIDGKEVKLTPKEFDLLVFLITHNGEEFSREELLERVWGYEFLGDSRTIDTHVKSLRNKLKGYRTFLVTVWGKGYKAELPQNEQDQ